MDATLLKSIDRKLCEMLEALQNQEDIEVRTVCDCIPISQTYGSVDITIGGSALNTPGVYIAGVDFPAGLSCVDSVDFITGIVDDPGDPLTSVDIDYGDGTFKTYNVMNSSHCYSCDGIFNGSYLATMTQSVYPDGASFSQSCGFSVQVLTGVIISISIDVDIPVQAYELCVNKGLARYTSDGQLLDVRDSSGLIVTAIGTWSFECDIPGRYTRTHSTNQCDENCEIAPALGVVVNWGNP